ncbi:MAG TPA: FG-GAP-like repeat-containing protein, partial [Candidatus Saccharimonadales bacterium]|nr:FG-GAP-like repeat-containing protein [Candidatus Saccharimonadales bacterium]
MTVLETDPGPPAPTTHGRARPGRGRLVVIAAVALGVLGVAVLAWWVASRSWTGASTPAELTALGAPRFVEVSAAAGVDQVYDGDFSFYVGGGVAAFDCDDDRRLDLYVAGGERPAALYRNASTVGSLAFTAEPSEVTDLPAVTGAYPIDIDGDRLTDLVVLRVGGNVILRGLGDCRFERANEALAIDGGDAWTVGFSATWETAGARLPTLAFGNYVVPEPASEGIGDCDRNWLVRPDTDASHATYGAATALDPGACALSMLFSDWDRSGRRDLRISNDRHYDPNAEEQLWRIAPDEAPRRYSRDEGWERLQIFGMGIASEDLTGDGYPEVYLTSQGDNKLQTLAD